MKKMLAVICVLVLLMPCALAESATSDADALLLEIADDMARQLTGLCGNEEYIGLFLSSSDSEVKELIAQWAGDWAKTENRRRAAVIFIGKDDAEAVFTELNSAGLISDQILELRDLFVRRFSTMLSMQLNSNMGVRWLFATSATLYSDVRMLERVEPGIAYVLMDYGNEHPMVLVGFSIGQDGAAAIDAAFVNHASADKVFKVISGEYSLENTLAHISDWYGADIPQDVLNTQDVLNMADKVRLHVY